MSKEYRYFTLHKLNNKEIEFGRVKISRESATPIDAAKKLLSSICEYEGLTKNNKLKCKALFYIRETTNGSNKKIYGQYEGSFKKYDKPVIVKLNNGKEIKHKMYAHVFKIKSDKMIIQKGGEFILEKMLIGHNSAVRTVIQLNDGRIVSGSRDGTLMIWDLETGQCVMTLIGHNLGVNTVIQLNDGCIMSGSHDKTLKIWDLVTGQRVMTLIGHNGAVNTVIQLNDGRIVSGSADNTLIVWNNVIQNNVIQIKVPEFKENNNKVFDRINEYIKRFTCCICKKNEANCLLNPCGHVLCSICSRKISNCPICQTEIESVSNINLGSLNSSFNKI